MARLMITEAATRGRRSPPIPHAGAYVALDPPAHYTLDPCARVQPAGHTLHILQRGSSPYNHHFFLQLSS